MTRLILLLSLLTLSCPTWAEPQLSPYAKRVWDLFASEDLHFSEDPDALLEFDVVKLADQKATVEEMNRLPEIQNLRARGQSLRITVAERLVNEFEKENPDFVKNFVRSADRWMKSLKAESPMKLLEARNRAAQKMGLRTEDFARPEMTNLRLDWERATQRELLRSIQDQSPDIPSWAFRQWREQQIISLTQLIAKVAEPLVLAEIRMGIEARLELTDQVGHMGWGDLIQEEDLKSLGKLRFQFDPWFFGDTGLDDGDEDNFDEPAGEIVQAQWSIRRPDGSDELIYNPIDTEVHKILYSPNGKSLLERDPLAILSLEDMAESLENTLRQLRLQQMGLVLNSLYDLPEQMSRMEFEIYLKALPKNIEFLPSGVPALLRYLNTKDPSSPLWELMGDLRWAGYLRPNNQGWVNRQLLAEEHDLPLWTLRSRRVRATTAATVGQPYVTIPMAPRSNTSTPTITAPIREKQKSEVPDIQSIHSSDAEPIYKVEHTTEDNVFYFSPNEGRLEDWTQVPATDSLAITEQSTMSSFVSIKTLSLEKGWLPLPTPAGQKLSFLELKSGRKKLSNDDFEIWREQKSGAYAIRAKTKSRLQVKVAFVKEFELVDLPEFNSEKVVPLGHELQKIGEDILSEVWQTAPPPDARRLTQSIKYAALYSYYPEVRGLKGPGLYGDLKAFLDHKGTLCVQCSQASYQILLRSLLEIYKDQPDYSFRAEIVKKVKSNALSDELHAAVGAYHHGQLQTLLDATPWASDPRAPTSSFLARKAFQEGVDALKVRRQQIVKAAEELAPKHLPMEAPFVRLNRFLKEALDEAKFTEDTDRTEPAIQKIVRELQEFENWVNVDTPGMTAKDYQLVNFHDSQHSAMRDLSLDVINTTCELALKNLRAIEAEGRQ